MPRKPVLTDALQSIPNTRSFAEARSYRVTIGEQKRIITFRPEIQIGATHVAEGMQLLEDVHEAFRQIIVGNADRQGAEIGDLRKRENKLYFSSLGYELFTEAEHEASPIEKMKAKNKGA